MTIPNLITFCTHHVERGTDFFGKMTWYCTLLMVACGAYNAGMRSLSGWSHIDPAQTGMLPTTLRWIGEIARQGTSNTFIELQWYLFSVIFLLGASYALQTGAHVRVDIFYNYLSATGRAWINLTGTLVFLFPFCILMIWSSWPSVADAWIRLEGSPDPGGLPRYPLLSIVPLAFLLLMAQGLAYAVHEAQVIFSSAQKNQAPRHHGS